MIIGYIKRIERNEIKLLDLIINYYKGILNKGYNYIETKTLISDLEEIKKTLVGSDEK